ncbi:MAG: HAD family phosphatase [Anaerolineales bacterium]|jgi:2-haloacid dehalogenase|nr:HAD family phosphatase [Anaerolineales bacterium]
MSHQVNLPARQAFPAKNRTVVIFDLGGVLIEWSPQRLYAPYFNSNAAIDQFLREINFPTWNAQQDAGRSFRDGVAELSAQFPHYADLIRVYHERWEDSVPGPIAGTLKLLKQLKEAGHPLYALTNFSAETFPLMRQRFDFLKLFKYILVSGEVGLIKPDPAIYHLMLQKIGQPPGDCLFIDDSAANISTAQQLGFDTIQFKSPAALEEELRDRKLLV